MPETHWPRARLPRVAPSRQGGPDEREHEALLQQIGPLPLRGKAWPNGVKILAWVILLVIAIQLMRTATGPAGRSASPLVAASILVCFAGLVLVAASMATSETRITRSGIEQSWITRRTISWKEIQFAKFIPLLMSKRLICFTRTGRPVVFQAGTRELQIAFARIALVYRRRQ
jgi:hypothetical protein